MALPGVQTIIQDQFYTLSRSNVPAGPLCLAIGVRNTPSGTFGVVDYDPYTATNELNVINAYGYGSQLHRAYLELVAGGATNIALVALPMGTVDAELTSTAPGNPVDTAFAAAGTANPDIIIPWGRGGHPDDWTAPGATPSAADASPAYGTPPQLGFHADDTPGASSMAARVAAWAANLSSTGNPVFAVLGVAPYIGVGQYASQNIVASQLANFISLPNLTTNGTLGVENTDIPMGLNGPYLSVVATEIIPTTYPFDNLTNFWDFGYSNGACMYAGAISQLAAWNSTTGNVIQNVAAIRYNPSQVQLSNLSTMGVVPVGLDYNRLPRWMDGTTFAQPNSDFVRLTTLRITFDAIQLVRQIALQFVGQGATTNVQSAFQTAISSGLRSMIQVGALISADSNITYNPSQNLANVDLVLTPAFELRNVVISVMVNF